MALPGLRGDQFRSRFPSGAGEGERAGAAEWAGGAEREGAAAREGMVRTGADRLCCPRPLKSRVWLPRLYPPKRLLGGAGLEGRGTAVGRPR